jgi:predicted DNA binding CopG/RHH family protein
MKKQKINDPFATLVLDEEEKFLEEAFEKGEVEEDPNIRDTKTMLEEAAKNYLELNTAKPITIRVNQFDLIKVKARAKHKQIPYQTLLGSLIHQYAEGKHEINL